MNLPEIVYFKITSKCNHNCRYCYDVKNSVDLDFEGVKKIIMHLKENGVKGVVLSGGEPLIREDASKILEEINKNNMNVYLDTNGDFFFRHKDAINKFVDVLGLPLDYSSEKLNYRSRENFGNVIKILDYYQPLSKKPTLRIGTVVTKENISDLSNIAEILKNYSIDSWKIYQFIPIGPNAEANQKELETGTKSFEEAALPVKEKYSGHFKIIISKRKQRAAAYFFIDSNGSVFMPKDDPEQTEYIVLGSVFDKDTAKKWWDIANKRNYMENAEATLNYKFKCSSETFK